MKFNKWKSQVLHLGRNNPMRVLVENRLNMSQNYAVETQKATSILECTGKSVASRSKEVILPIYLELMRLHLEYCA